MSLAMLFSALIAGWSYRRNTICANVLNVKRLFASINGRALIVVIGVQKQIIMQKL